MDCRGILLATLACSLLALPAAAQDLTPIKVKLDGEFSGSDKVRKSISGIACAPAAADGKLQCLVALDEKLSAQWVTLTLGTKPKMKIGETIKLFGKNPDLVNITGGAIVKPGCPKGQDDDADENDTEGAAFIDGQFFLAASHGCGRNSGKFKESAFVDARVGMNGDARVGMNGETALSTRLNQALSGLPGLSGVYGLETGNGTGISIEGIAASGSTLYFGLREPLAKGADGTDRGIVVGVARAELFASGPLAAAVVHGGPALGQGMGIRDMALLDIDGVEGTHLLILAGPATGEGGPYSVYDYDVNQDVSRKVGDLPSDGADVKAEALLVAGAGNGRLQFLVMHDGAVDGDPQLFDVAWPQPN